MIRTKTVFVLGAGASAEVGMPLGVDLTDQIAAALNFRPGHEHESKDLARAGLEAASMRPDAPLRRDALYGRALQVSGGLATSPSIDVYIDNHAADPACALIGKIGIAACLIEAERSSTLRCQSNDQVDIGALKGTWFARLFNILAGGVKAETIQEMFANVAFVNFNYDRCLEQYLRYAIASRFHIGVEEAGRIVDQHCPIVHPYGSLGPLTGDSDSVCFGTRLSPHTLGGADAVRTMASKLLTFTESRAARAEEAKELIAQAERAIFLGFAFHVQNVELLAAKETNIVDYRTTALGASYSNRYEILRHIQRILAFSPFGPEHPLHDATCSRLIIDEEHFLSR